MNEEVFWELKRLYDHLIVTAESHRLLTAEPFPDYVKAKGAASHKVCL